MASANGAKFRSKIEYCVAIFVYEIKIKHQEQISANETIATDKVLFSSEKC